MTSLEPTLLCVHPHPDDESIACGGVLAKAADQGLRTVVVTCTGGEAGENLAGIDLGDEDLVAHRERELAEALTVLGVAGHYPLGYRDSGMASDPGNDHPDSFHRVDVEVAAVDLATILRTERPQVVVSDDADGTYGHPDHIKSHHVTVRAVQLAADPTAALAGEPWQVAKHYAHTLATGRILAVHQRLRAAGLASPFGEDDIDDVADLPFGSPDELVTTEVDVRPWIERKRAAMAAHRSQISEDSFFLNTPPELDDAVFGTEQFVLLSGQPGPVDASGREPDLFAGLPTAAGVSSGASSAGSSAPLVDAASFKAALGSFVTGVTVMTTFADDAPHGMTANAIASLSLEPPLVLVNVARTAEMASRVKLGGVFALSILARDQRWLSDRFADSNRKLGHEEFDGVDRHTEVTGAPVLDGAAAFVDCRVRELVDGGDHVIVVGEVVAAGAGDAEPLAYHRGRYGGFLPAPDADGA